MQVEQRDKELAAIGASIGCNCRPCVEHHIAAGRRRAGEMTAEKATHTLDGLGGLVDAAAVAT
jgi:AhpD family alkylhydroperoxidase